MRQKKQEFNDTIVRDAILFYLFSHIYDVNVCSAFLVLYVTGITCELSVISVVLHDALRRGLGALSVAEVNVSVSVLIFALLYLPGISCTV
jgi:hypothetical protein